MVDGLFTSKINYGLQLYGKVRIKDTDSKNGDIKEIQKVHYKMARFLNNKTLKDKISSKTLLIQSGMLSVNQLNAKIKIQEIWKALNIENYPLKIKVQQVSNDNTNTRAMSKNRPIELGSTALLEKTCIADAIKLWNIVPEDIKNSKSIHKKG